MNLNFFIVYVYIYEPMCKRFKKMPSVLRLLLQYEVNEEHRIQRLNRYITILPTSYHNLLEIIYRLYAEHGVETRSRRLYIKKRIQDVTYDVDEYFYNTSLYENEVLICTIAFKQTARSGA